jgi:undecaprenyl-diphosphatase
MFVALALASTQQHLFAADLKLHALLRGKLAPAVKPLMQLLSLLGSGVFLVLLASGASMLLWRRRPRVARWLPAVVAGSILLGSLAKLVVARPRPSGTAHGFPSGHVFTSVVFFGAIIYLVATSIRHRGWRAAAIGACVVLIAGIAYSRLYLNAHWFTDVLGGLIGGGAYLLFAVHWAGPRGDSADFAAIHRLGAG